MNSRTCSNYWARGCDAHLGCWVGVVYTVKKYGEKKYFLKPLEGIELSTPSLRSNYWATGAVDVYLGRWVKMLYNL